jgi:hypothetical protein
MRAVEEIRDTLAGCADEARGQIVLGVEGVAALN